MKSFLKWSVLAPVSVVLFIGSVFVLNGLENKNFGCSIDRGPVKEKIIAHLTKKGLDPEFLLDDPENDDGCNLSYIYKSDSEHIHFMVLDGYKLTWWDFKRRGYE